MPNIQNILSKIFEELGLVEARHPELIEKFEILVSKLFIAVVIDQHLDRTEANILFLNFEMSKKNGADYAKFLDTLLPLSVIDYYLYIASVTILKEYIEFLLSRNLVSKEFINSLIEENS